MANADDTVSMVGAPPRRTPNIDKYPWGRAALNFTGVAVEQHETLAEHLGGVTAAEVLLLIIARKCETNKRKWQEAKDLGIPWLNKRWSSLTNLQEDYNDAVAAVLDAALSDSPAPDFQPAPCADQDAALSSTSHRDSPSLRLPGPTSQTSKEEEEWQESNAQESSKKVAAKNMKSDLPEPDPPGADPATLTCRDVDEDCTRMATPACPVHRDGARRREEEQQGRNVRPRAREQDGPRPPNTPPPRVVQGHTPIMDATTGGAVPAIVNPQAPPPHRQANPFRTIHDSDVTKCPNADTLNIHIREAMARRPSETLNDDWPKHFNSIGVCSVGLENLREII